MKTETPHQASPEDADNTVKGIVALVIATLFFAGQDAITKHLTEDLPVMQIIFVRFFFFTIFALVYATRRIGIKRAFRSEMPAQQIMRGLLIVGEIGLFAWCLQFMGLAEMHAIFACFPLVITALSVPFLGEQVGWRRWLAVFIGFVGTVVIIQPGNGEFNFYAVLVLVCVLMFSIYNLLTRKVSRKDCFETSLIYFGIVGFLASLVSIPFYWQALNTDQAVWLLTISVTSIIGHLLLIKALQLAPAVILQPFNYFVLVWAIIIGYLVYGEVLGTTALLGAGLVVLSGIYIARREYAVALETRRKLRSSMYPPEV
ncbi:MAG: DMT family transporter [Gammaproteobacteria bacterium]|nr:DMT family transporter [Gammaproteobacteria bacterium]